MTATGAGAREGEGVPSANDFMDTDKGMMAFSQYVGLHIAEAMRERGLWRTGYDPLIVLDRLRDMAALSRAAIDAMNYWQLQLTNPQPDGGNG